MQGWTRRAAIGATFLGLAVPTCLSIAHPSLDDAGAAQAWQDHPLAELFGGMLPALVITALIWMRWGWLAALLGRLTGREGG